MVLRREIACEGKREIAGRSPVREVLRHDWIQIVSGAVAGSARPDGVVSPAILDLGESAGCVEAPTGENHIAMQTGLSVAQRVDFDHAAHLPPIFGRNTGGV